MFWTEFPKLARNIPLRAQQTQGIMGTPARVPTPFPGLIRIRIVLNSLHHQKIA